MTATAAWPLDTLAGSLARAGWGPLAEETQGVRTVFQALVNCLPHGSAHGRSTATQLATLTGLTERWVRHCLKRLESLGVLTWRRGWRRVAGAFTLYKRQIAAWIRDARNPKPEPPAADEAPTPASKSKPELSTGLTTYGEVTTAAYGAPSRIRRPIGGPVERQEQEREPHSGSQPPPQSSPATVESAGRAADRARALIRAARTRQRHRGTGGHREQRQQR